MGNKLFTFYFVSEFASKLFPTYSSHEVDEMVKNKLMNKCKNSAKLAKCANANVNNENNNK